MTETQHDTTLVWYRLALPCLALSCPLRCPLRCPLPCPISLVFVPLSSSLSLSFFCLCLALVFVWSPCSSFSCFNGMSTHNPTIKSFLACLALSCPIGLVWPCVILSCLVLYRLLVLVLALFLFLPCSCSCLVVVVIVMFLLFLCFVLLHADRYGESMQRLAQACQDKIWKVAQYVWECCSSACKCVMNLFVWTHNGFGILHRLESCTDVFPAQQGKAYNWFLLIELLGLVFVLGLGLGLGLG
jgi:hypothetical protein